MGTRVLYKVRCYSTTFRIIYVVLYGKFVVFCCLWSPHRLHSSGHAFAHGRTEGRHPGMAFVAPAAGSVSVMIGNLHRQTSLQQSAGSRIPETNRGRPSVRFTLASGFPSLAEAEAHRYMYWNRTFIGKLQKAQRVAVIPPQIRPSNTKERIYTLCFYKKKKGIYKKTGHPLLGSI